MGRSGLVGLTSILLLLVAAIVVMVSTSQGAAVVERVLGSEADSASAISPSMRAVTPSGAMGQADRAIQDMETADQLMRDVTNGASATPLTP